MMLRSQAKSTGQQQGHLTHGQALFSDHLDSAEAPLACLS